MTQRASTLEVERSMGVLRVVRRRDAVRLIGFALLAALFLSALSPLMPVFPAATLWGVLILGAVFTATHTEYRVQCLTQSLEVVVCFLGRQWRRSFPLECIQEVRFEQDAGGDGVTYMVRLHLHSGVPVPITTNSNQSSNKPELAALLSAAISEFRRPT